MGLLSFTSEKKVKLTTTIDNIFFTDYMIDMPTDYVKIYLYGYYVITNELNTFNNLEDFSHKLKVDETLIHTAFKFFDSIGLCHITSTSPLNVQYVNLKDALKNKKVNANKYKDFSLQVQKVLSERMITPNEFNEYYSFMDRTKLDQNAFIMLIKYCTDIKGDNVSYSYILTVARDWVNKNITTVKAVTDELSSRAKAKSNINQILIELKIKRAIDNDDNELYAKWTKDYGFDFDNIIFAISLLKGKKSIIALDKMLAEFYNSKAFSKDDMQNIISQKDSIRELTIKIVKQLGLYYENVQPVTTYYIKPWIDMGFDDNALMLISTYCMKKQYKTLDEMGELISSLSTQGLLTVESIKDHIANISQRDKRLARILEKAGINCSVTRWHRENYTTWSEVWGFSDEVIEYVAEMSIKKINPIPYMTATLSNLKKSGKFTIAEIDKYSEKTIYNSHNREYTDQELEDLIDDIDDLDI